MKEINLYPYQKELLNDFTSKKRILVKHSRQSGVSVTLIKYLTNLMLGDDKVSVLLFSNKRNCSVGMLNRVKLDITDIKGFNVYCLLNELIMPNGNSISIKLPERGTYAKGITHIIVDNAGFNNDLKVLLSKLQPLITEKSSIILSSSNNGGSYFNQLFEEENDWTKKIITWDMNHQHDQGWYDSMLSQCDNIESFNNEINMIDVAVVNKKTKNKIINIRLDDDILMKVTKKLVELDINLSDYIRSLMNKDCDYEN